MFEAWIGFGTRAEGSLPWIDKPTKETSQTTTPFPIEAHIARESRDRQRSLTGRFFVKLAREAFIRFERRHATRHLAVADLYQRP